MKFKYSLSDNIVIRKLIDDSCIIIFKRKLNKFTPRCLYLNKSAYYILDKIVRKKNSEQKINQLLKDIKISRNDLSELIKNLIEKGIILKNG